MKLGQNLTLTGVLLLTLTSCSSDTNSTPSSPDNSSNSSTQVQVTAPTQEEIRAKYQSDMEQYFANSADMESALEEETIEEGIISLRNLAKDMEEINDFVPPDELKELHDQYATSVVGFARRYEELADTFQQYADGEISDDDLLEDMEGFQLAFAIQINLAGDVEESIKAELGIY